MKVPLLDLQAQLEYLEDDILAAVTRVVKSTRYIQGPEVEEFEKEIAEYCGAAYGVGVTSGTDALLISLMSLGIGPGDKVLTTPYSFFATMGVILRVGAIPVFADIDPISFNIDPAKMEEVLAADTSREIKAIIPVHLYGQCADMSAIMEMAARYGLPVIEDAAQAIGAEYPLPAAGAAKGTYKRAGSMGLAGCFSFFPSKNLGGIGDAGMVVTQDKDFAERLVLMRNHGAHPKYYHKLVGGNFRLDPIQAAALRVKLPYLERWHAGRCANARRYDSLFLQSGLVDAQQIVVPKVVYSQTPGADGRIPNVHIYNQYILRVARRNELREWLNKNDIGCEVYYPVPLHKQECLGDIGAGVQCPEAEKAADTTIALPIYPELTEAMQEYVVEKIVQFYS
ncbi:DegT/DnrJ/EryC1/StrS family aminotransferase [Desulfopila sp. IMCC35006]|uniref:DegT/DnrJ/EryC1/StrS family aminotransferase n=1 Tax=Desulfopila sp. IMCC35006 TaxID=2569542 RepID=UPI0010AD3588|nr:DegT/DnrJ/EryC1/StrS family aminotransferase [Desulfopila sp. IMCC35006]TKB27697.1 DegT/DnrJ/EryC1/StrS family aminotransferase [Desulfopila sp. IMCC35006]